MSRVELTVEQKRELALRPQQVGWAKVSNLIIVLQRETHLEILNFLDNLIRFQTVILSKIIKEDILQFISKFNVLIGHAFAVILKEDLRWMLQ